MQPYLLHERQLGPVPTYFDMLPTASFESRTTNGLVRAETETYQAPAIQRASEMPMSRKVLGCKLMQSDFRSTQAPSVGPTYGLRANQGYGRHHRIGLAYTKPIDLPLMPLADSTHAGLINPIPLPP